jgi:hypothetical protein
MWSYSSAFSCRWFTCFVHVLVCGACVRAGGEQATLKAVREEDCGGRWNNSVGPTGFFISLGIRIPSAFL